MRLFLWGESKVQVTFHDTQHAGPYLRVEYRKLRKPWRYGRVLGLEFSPDFKELTLIERLRILWEVFFMQGKKLPGGSEEEVMRKFKERYGEGGPGVLKEKK